MKYRTVRDVVANEPVYYYYLGEGRELKEKVNKKAKGQSELVDPASFAWQEVTDDLKRDLALIGRVALSNEEVLNLPLPEENAQLWPVGTLLLDDDGTMYEWRLTD